MDDEIVLLLGVDDRNNLVATADGAHITHLSAALAVEWSTVENQLEELAVFGTNLAIADNLDFAHQFVVADKLLFDTGEQLDPVVAFRFGGSTRAVLLLGKAFGEAVHIDRPTLFRRHKLSEVDGEAVSVEEFECKGTIDNLVDGNLLLAGLARSLTFESLSDIIIKFLDSVAESFEKRLLLLEDDA